MTLSIPALALRRAFDAAVEEAISSRAGWSDLAAREAAEERGRDAARAYRAGELRRARIALGDCLRAEERYRVGPSAWRAVADLIGGAAAPEAIPSRAPIYAMRAAPKALRPCAICKVEYRPVQDNAKYCGDTCREESERRRHKEYAALRESVRKSRPAPAPKPERGPRQRQCEVCLGSFVRGYTVDGYGGFKYCSFPCAAVGYARVRGKSQSKACDVRQAECGHCKSRFLSVGARFCGTTCRRRAQTRAAAPTPAPA